MQLILKPLYLLFIIFLIFGCGGNRFKKFPLDIIIKDMPPNEIFSIILHDMDVQGNFSKTYYHSYEIIKGSNPENMQHEITDLYEVSKDQFNQYINDMGMEIAARDSTGKLIKTVAPPGYNNYVGNSRYGNWENRGGYSFWHFYGQYAFMSSLFNMATYPVRRSYHNDWNRNYRDQGKRYYGPSQSGGSSYYGTNSNYSRTKNPTSSWNNKSASFKESIRQRTSRSSGRSSRTSRFRSRGGGFGK